MAPETIKIHQKSMPRSRPRKNMIFFEKSDVPATCPVSWKWSKCGPKWHLKIMKKPTSKKYAKMMAKGSKRVGNGAKMVPKIMKKTIQNSMSKNDQKYIKKTWTNEGVKPRKSLFFLGKTIHFTKFTFSELGQKSHRKRHRTLMNIFEKSIQKSIQNLGSEK